MRHQVYKTIYSFKYQFIWLTVVSLALCSSAACDKEESPLELTDSSVIISINTRSTQTRADLTALPASNNEMINSWWVVFVDKTGKVAEIANSENSLSPCMEDNVECLLPAGTYTAYAFANMTQEQLYKLTGGENEDGIKFSKDAAVPKDILNKACSGIINGFHGNSTIFTDDNIPMSGYKENITVENTIQERFSIEVIRMLGKLEFSFTNKSKKTVSVKSIKFGDLHTGKIPLMPDYSNLKPSGASVAPKLLSDVTTQDYTHTVTELFLDTGDEDKRTHFYVRESRADNHPTGKYHFALEIERKGETSVENTLYALTEDLSHINRNDYILIPVIINDYSLKLDVRFYPPIGGYPAVILEDKDEEYYVKFGTEGYFEIFPQVIENGTVELPRDRFEITVGSLSGTSGVFTTSPAVDPETGELTGELSNTTGTSVVPLSIKVSQQNGDGTTATTESVTFSRNVYIIRANQ